MKDWKYLDELTGGMQKERIAVTPKIRDVVAGITDPSAPLEDNVARLYHWVQKNIRYISVKSSLSSGWSGHPAASADNSRINVR